MELATVYSTKNKIGTYTNSKGQFEIKTCQSDTLYFSYLGFKSRTIIVNNTNKVDTIALFRISNEIDAVEVNPEKLTKLNIKANNKSNNSYSPSLGRSIAYHLKTFSGSYLKDVTFYFSKKVKENTFRLIILSPPYLGDSMVSYLDTTIFVNPSSLFNRAKIDLLYLNIQIPEQGLFIGLEKINNNEAQFIKMSKTEDASTWVGQWGKNWNNYTAWSIRYPPHERLGLKVDFSLLK
jgi:hypothetical protein